MLRVASALLSLTVCATLFAREPLHIVGPSADSAEIRSMRGEVERVLDSARWSVQWRAAGNEIEGTLVVLKLSGTCTVGELTTAAVLNAQTPLASTAVSGDRVLPFVSVACDKVRGLLARRLAGARAEDRPALMGRAIGRLVAHELYHYLAQTKHHGSEGIASACVRATDLLADKFNFDSSTVAQIRPSQPSVPADDLDSEISGR